MRKNQIFYTLATLILAIGTSCSGENRFGSTLDTYLEGTIESTYIPGLVALVADKNGILYSGAFGYQNVSQDIKMDPDSIFRIASMTKPVTSVAVQMLVEEGKISLDDPVSIYLPAFKDMEVIQDFDFADASFSLRAATTQITIRQLLAHTSGIGYAFSNKILQQLQEVGMGSDPAELPLLFEPGTRWAYGSSTRVLGLLVEAVSGESLDDFMGKRIFSPLGMIDTSYVVPENKTHRVVTFHRIIDQKMLEVENPNIISAPDNGDGGLHSTAADYIKFIQMFLNDGQAANGTRLLTKESVELMGQNHTGEVRVEWQEAAIPERTRPFPLGAGRDTFGLGFQITGMHGIEDMRSPGSMSWAGIFNTEFWIDPEEGIGAVLLMQYLPFYDEAAIETLQEFESSVYELLRE
ncbi:MAG: beta-lactamase family protein [Gammaproteobacteria bacterium]|nr:beta-lactamase family protein [Gammaproteobacteria bacterium]